MQKDRETETSDISNEIYISSKIQKLIQYICN